MELVGLAQGGREGERGLSANAGNQSHVSARVPRYRMFVLDQHEKGDRDCHGTPEEPREKRVTEEIGNRTQPQSQPWSGWE